MNKAYERVANYIFADIYRLLQAKIEKKGRTRQELDIIICWLTGHTLDSLNEQLENKTKYFTFFDNLPNYNPNASKITGKICGYDLKMIDDPFILKVRQLDKLVDELAKGRPIEKVLRK